ncbi:hypothetical protein F2Q69_00034065 [Brassica cretica]|uniref:Uncharacterized protein n=1 Tax=Brassica cretica TaxID=69181 RepID=A0A8S9SMQ1_BRACR|nr:hypothetical protein F2Q69_00034065 [Brassica cretica]
MIFSLAEKGPFRPATKPAPSSVSLSSFSSKLVSLSSLSSSKEVILRQARPKWILARPSVLTWSKTVISKSTAKIIILANSSRKKDRKNTNTYGRRSPERSVRKETGQDPRTGPFSLVRLAHGRGRPPMDEDDQHHGHPAHGRRRPAPRSPRPWARKTSTTVTPPMGEEDQHHGRLAHCWGSKTVTTKLTSKSPQNTAIGNISRPVMDRSEYDDRNTNEPRSVIMLLPHMHAVWSLCSDRASVPLGRYVATELFRNVDTTISPCILVDPSMLSPEDRSEPVSCFSPF